MSNFFMENISRRQALERISTLTGIVLGAPILSGCDLIGGLFGVTSDKKKLDDLADEFDNVMEQTRGSASTQREKTPGKTEKRKQHEEKKKTSGKDFETYFFQGEELKDLELYSNVRCLYSGGNPYCFSPEELWHVGIGGLTGVCFVDYKIPSKKEYGSFKSGEIMQIIFEFQDRKNLGHYVKNVTKYGNQKKGHYLKEYQFGLIKENILSIISDPLTTISGFAQPLLYRDIMLNYVKRINPDNIIFKGEEKTKKEFKKEIRKKFRKNVLEAEHFRIWNKCQKEEISVKEYTKKLELLKSKGYVIPNYSH